MSIISLTLVQGYKYDHVVSGNVQSKSVDFYPLVTPDAIIATPSTDPYTAAQRTAINGDNTTIVVNSLVPARNSTARSNHMLVYAGVPNMEAIQLLDRFRHLTLILNSPSEENVHGIEQYIRNFMDDTWELTGFSLGVGNPRTLDEPAAGPDFDEKYRDGDGNVTILMWDFEGIFRSGGGCVRGDTIITLESGELVEARDLRPVNGVKPRIMARLGSERVARDVEETTYHHAAQWDMVHVVAGAGLWYHVTADHWCPIGTGMERRRAADLVVGDMIPDSHGVLWPVIGVGASTYECDVVDIDAAAAAYEVNGALLVRTMPHG